MCGWSPSCWFQGVEYGEDAGDQAARGGGLEDGLGRGGEQGVEGVTAEIPGKEGTQRDRQGEHDVEVRDGQKVWKLCFGPQTLIEAAAARAVSVAAGVVGVVLGPAAVAKRKMAA